MNQRRFITLAAIAVLGLAILAGRSVQEKSGFETERRALAVQRGELAVRLQKSEAALTATKGQSLATSGGAAASMKAAPNPTPSSGAGAEPRPANSVQEWLEDPEVQVLHFANERANLALSYGPFFQAHHLTSKQIEQLSDLIVRSRAYSFDLSEIHRVQGRSFSDPLMLAQGNQDRAEIETGMIEVLGVDGYAQLKNYLRSIDVRRYVGKIAGAAALEGVPIAREQADALTNILAAATPRYPLGGKAEFGQIDWKAAEAQAQSVLSPEQMKLLREDSPGVGPTRKGNEAFLAILHAAQEVEAAKASTE